MTDPKPDNDEIDLASLVQPLWIERRMIILIGVIGALLGLLASQLTTKYVSEDILITSGVQSSVAGGLSKDGKVNKISGSNYKYFEEFLGNGLNLAIFLKADPQANPESAKVLSALSLSNEGLKKAIRPEFSLLDKDKKALGVTGNNEESVSMVGFRLKVETSEPSNGKPLVLLGEYVKDALLRLELENSINAQCIGNRSVVASLRIAQIKDEFQTNLELSRAKTLRGLNGKGEGVRQLLSIDKGGERYLSPQAQLNAVEITLSELRLAQVARQRELQQSALRLAYYCEAANSLLKPMQASALLKAFQQIQEAVFKDQDKLNPIVDQTFTEINLQRDTWSNNYLRSIRFISPPELSESKVRGLPLGAGLALGALLGGLIAVFFVFIRNWWKSHQAEITAA
jgi:hypothetical protein